MSEAKHPQEQLLDNYDHLLRFPGSDTLHIPSDDDPDDPLCNDHNSHRELRRQPTETIPVGYWSVCEECRRLKRIDEGKTTNTTSVYRENRAKLDGAPVTIVPAAIADNLGFKNLVFEWYEDDVIYVAHPDDCPYEGLNNNRRQPKPKEPYHMSANRHAYVSPGLLRAIGAEIGDEMQWSIDGDYAKGVVKDE